MKVLAIIVLLATAAYGFADFKSDASIPAKEGGSVPNADIEIRVDDFGSSGCKLGNKIGQSSCNSNCISEGHVEGGECMEGEICICRGPLTLNKK